MLCRLLRVLRRLLLRAQHPSGAMVDGTSRMARETANSTIHQLSQHFLATEYPRRTQVRSITDHGRQILFQTQYPLFSVGERARIYTEDEKRDGIELCVLGTVVGSIACWGARC